MDTVQRTLSANQLDEFYNDVFRDDQVAKFRAVIVDAARLGPLRVVDIGGSRGYFACALKREIGADVCVVDMDKAAIEFAESAGIRGCVGDAIRPPIQGDEDVVCFNLMLHHLVSDSEAGTRGLQRAALEAWRDSDALLFVYEYVYQSFPKGFSSRLIYEITSSSLLSTLVKPLGFVFKTLRANTLGVGVRFRSRDEWRQLFNEAGYEVVNEVRGKEEPLSFPRKLMLISSKRRDAFLLRRVAA